MLQINDEKLEEKTSTKYPGLLIEKLHIHHVNLKILKGIRLIAKLRHFVPRNT